MSKPTRYQFELPVNTEEGLRTLLQVAFGIRIPDVQVCPNHSTPWRALCDAYFARAPVVVWEGSRGLAGKSYNMSALGLADAIGLGADVNILGGSGEQAGRVKETIAARWEYEDAPKGLIVGEAAKVTRFLRGNKIRVLMASTRSVRGPHPQRLMVDEVDECDLEVLDAALGQPMIRDGIDACTVLSSTHQYPDGAMTEVKRRAADRGWPIHTWCYKETLEPHGWLSKKQLELTRSTMTELMFQTEVELQEPSPTDRAIQPDKVNECFRRDLGVFEFPWKSEDMAWELEGLRPGSFEAAHGADWAKKQDRTVISTLNTVARPMLFVACRAMRRRPWPKMIAVLDERQQRFGGVACHDQTGLGDVVHDVLEARAQGILLNGQIRRDIFTNYVKAIEAGEVVWPFFALAHREHLYCSYDDLYGSGHPPDTVVSGALAYHAATKGMQVAWATA